MTDHLDADNRDVFVREVFPAELDEIRHRRHAADIRHEHLQREPTTANGLVGLALSGGGIRSATFSLGVLQALARHGVLRSVDYLSTRRRSFCCSW